METGVTALSTDQDMEQEAQREDMDHLDGVLEGQLLELEEALLYHIPGLVVHGARVGAQTPDLSTIQLILHQLCHLLSPGALVM